jgi:cytochrome c
MVGLSATPCASADDMALARGRAIAEQNCGRCHATGPAGASPLELAPPFRVLPQRYPVENLAEALAEGILTGHAAMPEFRFQPDEINALLSYIASLARGLPAKARP